MRSTTVSGLKRSDWCGMAQDWPSIHLDNVKYERQEERNSRSVIPLKKVKTSWQKSESTYIIVRIVVPATWRLDPTRFSSWLRLKIVRTWANHFIHNCTQPKDKGTNWELTVEEIDDSENQPIQLVKFSAFSEETNALRNRKELPKTIEQTSSTIIGWTKTEFKFRQSPSVCRISIFSTKTSHCATL